MTYKNWEQEIMKSGLTPNQARKDMGITAQSIYKWRKADKVGKVGLQYLERVKQSTCGSCSDVLAERGKEYGSFEDNIRDIAKYKPGLKVDYKSKEGKEQLVSTAIDYVSYMLALKAARSKSKTISSRSYIDCLTDFVNYYHLLESLLKDNCESYNIELTSPYDIKSTVDLTRDILLKTGM